MYLAYGFGQKGERKKKQKCRSMISVREKVILEQQVQTIHSHVPDESMLVINQRAVERFKVTLSDSFGQENKLI